MNKLWFTRKKEAKKELKRYGRYMFNDHLMIVLVFALGGLAFYYQQWIRTLSSSFPVEEVLAILLGLAVSASPIFTLIKEADIVYWTPMEKRLTPYFRKAFQLSVVIQSVALLVLYGVLIPLENAILSPPATHYLLTVVVLLAMNYCNALYLMERRESSKEPVLFTVARNVVNIGILWSFFSIHWVVGVVVASVVYGVLLTVTRMKNKNRVIPWHRWIKEQRLHWVRFYRLANLFTDVPAIKGSTKRRAYLDGVLLLGKKGKTQPHVYLLGRTIIRQDEWFGLFVRLTVIGGILLFSISSSVLGSVLSVVFIWLTAVQLLPLVHVHDEMVLQELYPVPARAKREAVMYWIRSLILFQSILYTLIQVLVHPLQHAAIMAFVYVVFSLFFTYFYAPKRLTSKMDA